MIKLKINNTDVEVQKDTTILQACGTIGIEIPRFCYHEKLSIAGNCRMCLVEVKGSPKPLPSCALPVSNGMEVYTNTDTVKKIREGIMEFLLVNHPLDCPICDQGGECDLQDQAYVYGNDRGRFYEYKRSVEDKYAGPLIKTIMTRCIHCTRCVRFSNEVAGVSELGTYGRGNSMEISSYIKNTLTSEVSGNIIDLCPVGALTSKPFAYTSRNWELTSVPSIDIFDGLGSNINIDIKGNELMRILPRANSKINEEWITDKVRFSYDGLKRQRLTHPLRRDPRNNTFYKVTWQEAFNIISDNYKGDIKGIIGNNVDLSSSYLFKKLLNQMGSNNIVNENKHSFSNDFRKDYLFNTKIEDLDKIDLCLVVGSNLRVEAPLLNVKLRSLVLKNNLKLAYIGNKCDLTYSKYHIGNTLTTLLQIAEGRHVFSQSLANSSNPLIIVGGSVFNFKHSDFVRLCVDNILKSIGKDYKSVNYLHNHCNSVGKLDLNISSYNDSTSRLTYIYNADNILLSKDSFNIYQGHNGDYSARNSDIILPSTAYTEKDGLYVNTEGRVQLAKKAITSPGFSKSDCSIFKALSVHLNIDLPYSTAEEVDSKLYDYTYGNKVLVNEYDNINIVGSQYKVGKSITTDKYSYPLNKEVTSFYQVDSITRSSVTMASCVREKLA